MDKWKLKSKIVEHFRTQTDFADAVGASEFLVSRVVRGRRSLDADELLEWSRLLKIQPSDLVRD